MNEGSESSTPTQARLHARQLDDARGDETRPDSPRLQLLDARPTLLMSSVLREKATHPDRDIGSTDYVAAGVHTAPT